MVEMNFGRARPEAILDLTQVEELKQHGRDDGMLRVGAGVTYTRAISELKDDLPGLAIASRTVGSPQIRNRGTIGGNLGSSSPAGDALPPLYASGAHVELTSTRGTRKIAIEDFITGPKKNTLEPDELIAAFHVAPANGAQQFSKIGTRNAMVIAVRSMTRRARWARVSARRRRRRGKRMRRRRSLRTDLTGKRARRSTMRRSRDSVSSSQRLRPPSTTSAGRRRTVGMRSRSWQDGR
jgi:CO/xanthine dehydrogenase FAD-binding subunit